jgi:hypothetical protein
MGEMCFTSVCINVVYVLVTINQLVVVSNIGTPVINLLQLSHLTLSQTHRSAFVLIKIVK